MKPKDLEKRLATAYDQGFFDGYHDGITDTHDIWVNTAKNVRGIGPKTYKNLMDDITAEMQRRLEAKGKTKDTTLLSVLQKYQAVIDFLDLKTVIEALELYVVAMNDADAKRILEKVRRQYEECGN